MNWWTRCLFGVVLAVGVAGGARVGLAQAHNLRVPLEHYADGRVKTQITAGDAVMGTDGTIRASKVKIELFGADGQLDGMVDADDCFIDREHGVVTSSSRVRFVQRGVAISGTGFEWQTSEQSFKLNEQPRVVFIRQNKGKLFRLP